MTSRLRISVMCLALLSLALCAGVSTVTALSDDSAQYVIKSTLEKEGFIDVSTRIGDGRANGGEKVLVLSYRSFATGTTDLATETAKIVGAFVGTVKSGWDCDSLMVVVGTSSGGTAGTWYCTKEWKYAYLDGQLDDSTLILKVLGSMESFNF